MKYLVELNSSDVKADFILSELHLEFGRSPEPTGDPDILRLAVDDGSVKVLCDYDHNRVWLTIETVSEEKYSTVSKRIEKVLEQSKNRGFIAWSQTEISGE